MSLSVIIDKHAMYVKYAQVMNSNTKYTRLSADRKDFWQSQRCLCPTTNFFSCLWYYLGQWGGAWFTFRKFVDTFVMFLWGFSEPKIMFVLTLLPLINRLGIFNTSFNSIRILCLVLPFSSWDFFVVFVFVTFERQLHPPAKAAPKDAHCTVWNESSSSSLSVHIIVMLITFIISAGAAGLAETVFHRQCSCSDIDGLYPSGNSYLIIIFVIISRHHHHLLS